MEHELSASFGGEIIELHPEDEREGHERAEGAGHRQAAVAFFGLMRPRHDQFLHGGSCSSIGRAGLARKLLSISLELLGGDGVLPRGLEAE